MLNYSKLVQWVLPNRLYKLISTHRTFTRQQAQNFRLKTHHPAPLESRHIDGVKIVLDRPQLLKQMPQNLVCAEVGVAYGEFSRQILDIMQPARLILIDLWSADSDRYAGAMQPALDQVRLELDQGLVEVKRGYSWDMLGELADQSLDWVYLDAAHDYSSVKKDLQAALPKMKPQGWICGHDYTRWSDMGLHRWGVVEAVNEFCQENDWAFRFLTHESHRHVSYALQSLSGNNQSPSSSTASD